MAWAVCEFFANEFHAGCADARGADAGLLLHPLDELHELWHGVHAEQGKEPAVEFECFLALAGLREIEELDRLCRVGVDETGDPALGSGVDAFDENVVDADEDVEAIAQYFANGRDAANVGA